MDRPYRCCNPLCTSTFDSVANLHRHARLSRKCAAYWDLRRVASLLSVSETTKKDTKTATINQQGLKTQLQVLPSIMLQNNDDINDGINDSNSKAILASHPDRMQTEQTNDQCSTLSTPAAASSTDVAEPTIAAQSPLLQVPTVQYVVEQQSNAIIQELEDELPTMFTVEQKSVVELLCLLDDLGAPDYAVEAILKWANNAKNKGFNFNPHSYNRRSNLKWIYNSVNGSQSLLPTTVQIDLEPNKLGMTK